MANRQAALEAATSLPAAFFDTAKRYSSRPAQWYRTDQGYVPVTYGHLQSRIRHVATGLMRVGIKAGDRVALLMENIPEWAVADYAILSIGAVTVPLYCSYRPQDIAYVLRDSGARLAITSCGKVVRHLLEAANSCPKLKAIHMMGEMRMEVMANGGKLCLFAELEAGEVDVAGLETRLKSIGRDTLATLIYTSGTTGEPKGVMLSHGNILANLKAIPGVFSFKPDDKMLSFLPLPHALERMASHFLPYTFGISVAFAERPDTVAKNMAEAKPSILIAVPRVLEVVRDRILGQATQQSRLKQSLFRTFLVLGTKKEDTDASPWRSICFRWLDRLIGRKIRARFGGKIRLMVSGGAPLNTEVAEFFKAVGMPVLEGYGMTEAAPLISVDPVDDRRLGSVGRPVTDVEVNIAGDGEILVRGPNVMFGYWKRRKETSEAIVNGWLHTGDIGDLDADDYLRITDRKKDMIVNSGGENIAPQRIEGRLVAEEMIEQVLVYGDKKPYLVAIIVPAEGACLRWAHHEGLPETDWAHLAASDILRKALQTRISGHLKGLARHEQVRRICIHSQPLGIEEGLLTPTMKIKRRRVYERFRRELEALY